MNPSLPTLPTKNLRTAFCILPETAEDRTRAEKLGQSLQIPIVDDALTTLQFKYQFRASHRGLELFVQHEQGTTRLYVDFIRGSLGYRRKHGGGYRQLLAKAVGLKGPKQSLSILDATAGLGQDAFVLACLGARLQLVERSPIIGALLEDGLARAFRDPELSEILRDKMALTLGDAKELLNKELLSDKLSDELLSDDRKMRDSYDRVYDVVYLDPMFPKEDKKEPKTALTTIDLRIIRDIVGPDLDASGLFKMSLAVAKQRVVVKRPKDAPRISEELSPSFVLLGKKNRYDVYLCGHPKPNL